MNMKKIISILLAALLLLSLAACSSGNDNKESDSKQSNVSGNDDQSGTRKPEKITITALNGSEEETQVEVPYDPQRIAILDFAALDVIDNLGLGDRVVGTASTTLDYLMSYTQKDDVKLLGTIKEADLEAVMECEPDIIFIGGRLSSYYDELSEIAPVVFLATDAEEGVVGSTRRIAETVASIFGLEDQVADKLEGYDARIQALAEFAEGKTAVVGMCTGGSFKVLGNDGRCSIIGVEIGFDNLSNGLTSGDSGNGGQGGRDGQSGRDGQGEREGQGSGNGGQGGGTSTHGNEASFELIVSLNPDYIFVMDRDAAIGTDGAKLAKDVMENDLIKGTDVYKNGNIVYLEHPAVWYTAEGGVTALDMMLSDLESVLLK